MDLRNLDGDGVGCFCLPLCFVHGHFLHCDFSLGQLDRFQLDLVRPGRPGYSGQFYRDLCPSFYHQRLPAACVPSGRPFLFNNSERYAYPGNVQRGLADCRSLGALKYSPGPRVLRGVFWDGDQRRHSVFGQGAHKFGVVLVQYLGGYFMGFSYGIIYRGCLHQCVHGNGSQFPLPNFYWHV